MRCTYSLCQSGHTSLIERTCRLVYVKGTLMDCSIEEMWLCSACGNPFRPSVSRVMPWHLMRRLDERGAPQGITKSAIVKEFFR